MKSSERISRAPDAERHAYRPLSQLSPLNWKDLMSITKAHITLRHQIEKIPVSVLSLLPVVQNNWMYQWKPTIGDFVWNDF